MNISTGFDPEAQRLTVSVETNLLIKYYPNLASMIQRATRKPRGLEVSQRNKTTAVVTFPIPKNQVKVQEEKQRAMVAIDKSEMDDLMDIITRFANAAIRREFMTTEFIPLVGYSVDDLKEDIKKAIPEGRRFCIIDTYENYLTAQSSKNFVYNQYVIEPGTDEYADVAILIQTGNMKELQSIYTPKLKKTEWT